MKANKHTSRALTFSVVSLVLCVALLLGTTMAWFTDSVTNTGNVIEAGNLSISATAYDLGTGGKTVTISGLNNGQGIEFEAVGLDLKSKQAETTSIISETKWEPGVSSAKLLTVKNTGDLATNIRLNFDVKDGGLEGALWFDFVRVEADGTVTGAFEPKPMSTINDLSSRTTIKLEENQEVSFVLAYGMYETAGNIYKNTSFSADVTIMAAQASSEKDGFGSSSYDQNALYPQLLTPINDVIAGTIVDAAQPVTLSNSDGTASVVVPANTLNNEDELSLSVERTAAGENSVIYEIDLTVNGVSPTEDLTNPLTINLQIGAGLENVKVNHNDVPLRESSSGADQTYSYNADNGILSIVTASFSPFEIFYTMPEPAAKIGDIGYASLSAALSAAEAGDTITLLKNIVIDKAQTYSDPWGDPGMAGIPKAHNVTIDGAGYTITAPEDDYLFGDLRNCTIKNVVLELRGSGAVYFTWNVAFENVTTSGEAEFSGNQGAFVTYHYDGSLTMKNCINKATLTAGGAWGNYNAVFVGYPVRESSAITFDGCINEGSLLCGTAAMFIANPHYTAFTVNINDCANNGLIQATYPATSTGKNTYTPNLLTAVTNDGTNTKLTVNADGKVFKGTSGDKSVYNIPVGGNPIVNGAQDSTLNITMNEDGSFTVTPATDYDAAYYVVSYGVYSILVDGGSKQHAVFERMEETGDVLTTEIKNYKFVDKAWTEANPDAVETSWNEYTVYSLNGESFYLLPTDDIDSVTLNGVPRAGSQCSVSAYSAEGKLLASAQYHF